MSRKTIVLCLKRDIAELVQIAQNNIKSNEEHDRIIVLRNCIWAGLADYELAWRGFTNGGEE